MGPVSGSQASKTAWGVHKLQRGKFQLDIRKNIFTTKVVKHQNSNALLLREAEKPLSLGIFQLQPNMTLNKLTKLQSWSKFELGPALSRRTDQMTSRGPFHLHLFFISIPYHSFMAKWKVGGNHLLSKYCAALKQSDSKGQIISWGKERNVMFYFHYRPL